MRIDLQYESAECKLHADIQRNVSLAAIARQKPPWWVQSDGMLHALQAIR